MEKNYYIISLMERKIFLAKNRGVEGSRKQTERLKNNGHDTKIISRNEDYTPQRHTDR